MGRPKTLDEVVASQPAGFRVVILSCGWCPRGEGRLDLRAGPPMTDVEAWFRRHAECEEEAERRGRPGVQVVDLVRPDVGG